MRGTFNARHPGRRVRWAAVSALVVGGLASPLAISGAKADSGCSWPMYQQNISRTGAACDTNITPQNAATLHPAWFTPTAGPVTATPTVADGKVFVGDDSGTFNAFDQASGSTVWSFSINASHVCHGNTIGPDHHAVSYGPFTSTAAVSGIGHDVDPVVFFGGGGTLYAADAATGACLWAQDLDPSHPTSAMEVESSPVVATIGGVPEVIVGSDSNEGNSPASGPPGVQAFNARSGALLWKFEPEMPTGQQTVDSLASTRLTDGCGDVWTSPAVDPAFSGTGGQGLVVFATGNCPPSPATGTTVEGITAVYANNGEPAWRFQEPGNLYTGSQYPDGGDTDFGSSPIITSVAGTHAVIEGSKSGYVYAVAESTGTKIWGIQAAQPGELGSGPGAIGGFIGGAALGSAAPPTAAASPAWFGATAIPAPFTGAGIPSVDTSLACVDTTSGTSTAGTSACDPLRAASLHAVDASTGKVLWQAPISLPSYAAVSYVGGPAGGGVVFAPSTTGFSIVAYDADTGTPLWSFPLGAAVASGTAVVGSSIYLGTGIYEGGQSVPGVNGVWSFQAVSG
ncbi:MAG TPA: PQQ-binding-like beta-propeller repeat protein [Acidimicrobiales bacterium]|nr:PQQ-binding-like beta-propeller repeat protein [Acidimicrobiales bacterium]